MNETHRYLFLETVLLLTIVANNGQSLKAITPRRSVKKAFLKISRNSQENTCARVFFQKSCRPQLATLLKRNSGTGTFL